MSSTPNAPVMWFRLSPHSLHDVSGEPVTLDGTDDPNAAEA
jgi:hypothetical protein